MKKLKYILSAIIIVFAFTGCEDEDVADTINESAKPNVSFSASTSSAVEFESTEVVISITLDKPIRTSTTFTATPAGGTAVLGDDYTVSGGVVPAYTTQGEIIVSIIKDPEIEGNETFSLQIGAASIPDIYEVIGTETVSIDIEDWDNCLWALDVFDAYGDGWQGGFITVAYDNATSVDYSPDGASSSFMIPITNGAAFSITYTSGGGTGGAPGWEVENTYKLTAPDGTVYEDGPIPTEGVIASGTNTCP